MTEQKPFLEAPSAALAHLGIAMTDWNTDFARFEAEIAPFMTNRSGIPHGGIYAMILDTAMGYSGAFTGDMQDVRMTLTLSLTVNYLSRPKGARLIAEGRRVGGGAKTFFTEGRLLDETGELIATAVGTFKVQS
ncbi:MULTISPECIES: PaaI family thioesterase [Roseobacteraceae]|uniref:PaaI family thioesterase n=1 Tax=Roseobacteraceae TaxID=2854170 RepID=UPI00125FAFB6|nr:MULTISPECIES: PaaI family thioesterase [Roseobacteraceae]KAB6717659.1 PaaI family thioesterase [Roseobacter sp. TSBP12]|tara:strand:+ start:809 stop:1210 length:402 start_codon:yes stop_codon:yes gene_type:complete